MTSTGRSAGGAVHWLTAQAVVFGAMAALLGIVANALFLDAYGSNWLPVTYIAIGVAGIVLSGAVSRTARTVGYLHIAIAVLGGSAAAIGAGWVIAAGGNGAWVSVPLLVLFPILIQLGFVFIGAQGGRLLDIAGIKAYFPRIMAGFPVGAVAGGLLGGWLVTWLGRTESLLLATAIAQATFAALVWATARRFTSLLREPDSGPAPSSSATEDDSSSRSPMRRLFRTRFLGLLLAYQVLSALASQLSDFLVFDRASAQYPDPAALARYLAGYTAVMNIVSIAFLFVVAGPLLRRYGLRLGITSNPIVLTVLAVAIIAVFAVAGGGSLALLGIVSGARIADIALTDGTTRTSINATYQVIPERLRLSAQTAVEGIGVPVAIGISGVLILVLNALPIALAATIAVTTVVCLVWTWSGILLYRAYGPALVDAVRRRRVLDPDAPLEATDEDEEVARGLLVSTDPRAARLGLDLLNRMTSPRATSELASLIDDPRADVRLAALAALAGAGDELARQRLADEVRVDATSPDAAIRRRAARGLEPLDASDRAAAAADLLVDDDVTVRSAALDSVQTGDEFAVKAVLAGLDDHRSLEAAAGAVARLGDAVIPSMAELLEMDGSPASPRLRRLVRAAATRSTARDDLLRRHVRHRDRELGLIVMERLVAPEPASDATALALDDAMHDDARHAARILTAFEALRGVGDDDRDGDGPVRRALGDEFDLVRQRVMTGRLARHGSDRLGPVMIGVNAGSPGGALAVEALEVALGPAESRQVLPIVQADLRFDERLARLGMPHDARPDAEGRLRDLILDADGHWRSAWLRACAIHAAKARGILGQIDVSAARALGDPIVDEVLVGVPIAGS